MGARVVLAEDEAIIRLDLKETLEDEGYEVVGETGRGDEAVQLVKDLGPDLAILDIKMPGLDGLTFSQRHLVERARDAGALAYLVKPFQRSELIPAVEVALGRFKEVKALEAEVRGLEEQLETRRLVDRAKGIIMDEHGLAEAAAFSFIQRNAMRQRVTMRVVAAQVIDGSLRPEG
jgi:AmiR/NasT family two-component response regulator